MNNLLDALTTNERVTCPDCGVDRFKVLTLTDKQTGEPIEVTMKAACQCQHDAIVKEEASAIAAQKAEFVRRARNRAMSDKRLHSYTFDKDSTPQMPASVIARRYVKQWDQMQKEGYGLLIHGGVGTGKTFYAAAIVNALIDEGKSAYMTTISALINAVSINDREEELSRMNRADLLVIDDLGAERQTEYSLEVVYAIIDSRVKSGKPMIVTTNYSPTQMMAETELTLARIYDRVLEVCPIRIEITGKSRRATHDKERVKNAQAILFGDMGDE